MKYLIVGGQARGVGKTALVVDIIRAFSDVAWTAVKISPHAHAPWTEWAQEAQASTTGAILIAESGPEPGGMNDTRRYRAAGAKQALFVRSKDGNLERIQAALEKAPAVTENFILESNSILGFLQPGLFVMVLDPANTDFKESARKVLDRADAFVVRGPVGTGCWEGIALETIRFKPVFEQRIGEPLPEGLLSLIRKRLF